MEYGRVKGASRLVRQSEVLDPEVHRAHLPSLGGQETKW